MSANDEAAAAIDALDNKHVWEGMDAPMVVKWMDAALQKRRREEHLAAMRQGLVPSMGACACVLPTWAACWCHRPWLPALSRTRVTCMPRSARSLSLCRLGHLVGHQQQDGPGRDAAAGPWRGHGAGAAAGWQRRL